MGGPAETYRKAQAIPSDQQISVGLSAAACIEDLEFCIESCWPGLYDITA